MRTLTVEQIALVPDPQAGWPSAGGARRAVRASPLAASGPAMLVRRKLFAAGGAGTAFALAAHVPSAVSAVIDEHYGGEPRHAF